MILFSLQCDGLFLALYFVSFHATRVYSLSHKTVNSRENLWNVYCFATNQMMKAQKITDKLQNSELAFSSTRNFPFGSL